MGLQLAGKVALITGAARGIGAAMARAFSSEGAVVAAADIDARELAGRTAEIPGSVAIAADVADAASVQAMVERTVAAFGRLDVLVNNAGIGHTREFLETTLEEWEHVIRVNLTGCFLCAQAAARVMAEQGGGTIVNVASISGQRGGARRAAYGVSKAGVIQLTRVLAVELAPYRIRVNAIAPGPTETAQVRECHDEETRRAYYGLLPLKRYAAPEEIAAAAVFLASDKSSFVTGHVLNVDGGFSAAGLMIPQSES